MEHELNLLATLTYGGIVGRAQNRAMVENLKMPLTPVERIDLTQFDTIATQSLAFFCSPLSQATRMSFVGVIWSGG